MTVLTCQSLPRNGSRLEPGTLYGSRVQVDDTLGAAIGARLALDEENQCSGPLQRNLEVMQAFTESRSSVKRLAIRAPCAAKPWPALSTLATQFQRFYLGLPKPPGIIRGSPGRVRVVRRCRAPNASRAAGKKTRSCPQQERPRIGSRIVPGPGFQSIAGVRRWSGMISVKLNQLQTVSPATTETFVHTYRPAETQARESEKMPTPPAARRHMLGGTASETIHNIA